MNASPFRYFVAIRLHSGHHIAVLAGVTAVGLWTVGMSPDELDSALGMLLFVQMFLASTGFLARARRGHFDPILTSAFGRVTVVCSHWCASALPGVVAWAMVVGVDSICGGGQIESAVAGRRLLALWIVSAIAWTAGFALARGAAGALWTAGLVAALLNRTDLLGSSSGAVASSSPMLVLRHTAAVIACPFLLLGTQAPLAHGAVAAAAFATTICLCGTWRSVGRIDFYLRDRA
jgi:hypothetical protein